MRPEVIPVSRPLPVVAGAGGSLTGRIAYTCNSFLAIGGYDEEEGVLGSGYQDVDITLRINHQATKIIKAGCATYVQGGDLSHADVTEGVGFALPNHPSNKWDLNCEAKVKNIDPEDFRKAGGHEWSNVNQKNKQIMKAKMQTQIYTRNQISGHNTQQFLLCMAKNVGNWWVSTLPATP